MGFPGFVFSIFGSVSVFGSFSRVGISVLEGFLECDIWLKGAQVVFEGTQRVIKKNTFALRVGVSHGEGD
jgi:hypothetical protein